MVPFIKVSKGVVPLLLVIVLQTEPIHCMGGGHKLCISVDLDPIRQRLKMTFEYKKLDRGMANGLISSNHHGHRNCIPGLPAV